MSNHVILRVTDSNNNHILSLFDTEDGANRESCFGILELIRSHWTLPNCTPMQLAIATQINNHIINSEFDIARVFWNKYCCGLNISEPYKQLYELHSITSLADKSVMQPMPLAASALIPPGTVTPIVAPNLPSPPIPYFGVVPISSIHAVPPAVKVTSSGARCRHCKVDNEYAQADNISGTYLCTGCKLFGAK